MDFLEIVEANDIEKLREEIAQRKNDKNLLYRALILAAEKGYLEIVQLLIESGADVNYQHHMKDVKTPLIYAVQERHFEIVKYLVEKGADVNAIAECEFALGVAADLGYEEIFDYLAPLTELKLRQDAEESLPAGIRQRQREESADPRTNKLCSAAFDNNIDEVREILASGVDINAFNWLGSTALKSAIRNDIAIIKILLEAGANPNVGDDENAQTPLIQAVGNTPKAHFMCALLIAAGANVNAQTYDGMTALMWAARRGSLEILTMLLEEGADVNIKNAEGKTALDYALEESQRDYSWAINVRHAEVIEVLQKAAATNS